MTSRETKIEEWLGIAFVAGLLIIVLAAVLAAMLGYAKPLKRVEPEVQEIHDPDSRPAPPGEFRAE